MLTRSLLLTSGLCLLLLVAGCPDSHGRDGDGGTDAPSDTMCGGGSPLICVSSCGSDAGLAPICSGGIWTCPPGTRDLSTCPPTCLGVPPPGCVCMGTSWACDDMVCPSGIDPWDPTDPASTCSIEGAHCSSGGSACGAAMFCDCRAGRWECVFAEPDPVCWCGREPSEGDLCNEEGASCGGGCCPTTPGEPSWPAMQCVGGRWHEVGCVDLVCPPPVDVVCPADTASWIGWGCSGGRAICGNPCCGTAISCIDGRWQRGPDAACACDDTFVCGPGSCAPGQYCDQACGAPGGSEYTCPDLPDGCTDCDCIPLWGTQACEMIDGHPHVRQLGPCALSEG